MDLVNTEKFAIGHLVSSKDISAGGHLWRIVCYPRGCGREEHDGEYLSIYLVRMCEPKDDDIKATLEASVMDRGGALFSSHRRKVTHSIDRKVTGFPRFVKRSVLDSFYLTNNGSFIITCDLKVMRKEPLDVPPSDVGSHLGHLLDCADGSDVSFVVDGEKFPAHWAVLAARSPVFKAQLLGSMAGANMSSITLHGIAPATFKVLLRFMYTDACPADDELGDSPDDMFAHLLAAADRFVLDRLKIFCARKLWDNISVDSVAATLICAETHNCPQLKKKCIDFIVEENNFKKVVLTHGFVQLAQQFPSILDDLREKVGA
ncbi:unnamed protein product [Miscanthus lutarioriparius]|uniref:Uncharacterized protein n=1 Tax=Miscanthus lutarioriparius TaxID=422564 RepID=A0A811MRR8_9POAL|nr:unnamed protein product [Miscanthus lutarioriparius]